MSMRYVKVHATAHMQPHIERLKTQFARAVPLVLFGQPHATLHTFTYVWILANFSFCSSFCICFILKNKF